MKSMLSQSSIAGENSNSQTFDCLFFDETYYYMTVANLDGSQQSQERPRDPQFPLTYGLVRCKNIQQKLGAAFFP